MSRAIPASLAACFSIACALTQPSWASTVSTLAPAGPNRTGTTVIPDQYKTAVSLLELIKSPNTPKGAFKATNAPTWDVTQFMSHISQNGIIATDINGHKKSINSYIKIKTAIETRKGKTFEMFAHLSHIYSQPYKQYSELRFEALPGGVKFGWQIGTL